MYVCLSVCSYFSFYCLPILGAGVQDQLDALTLSPIHTEMEQQQQQTSGTPGCQQCMGLSHLSFAASTLPPANVHSHDHNVLGPHTHEHVTPINLSDRRQQELLQQVPRIHIGNSRQDFPHSIEQIRASLSPIGSLQLNGIKPEKEG